MADIGEKLRFCDAGGLSRLQPLPGLTGQAPLGRQRGRYLRDFHAGKWFLQNQESIVIPESVNDVVPGMVGVRRTDHRLNLRINPPNVLDGLEPERDRLRDAQPELDGLDRLRRGSWQLRRLVSERDRRHDITIDT